MLTFLKYYIKLALTPCLYFIGLFVAIATVFKNAKWGFFLLIFMIPQPNLWYKFHAYPYGKDFLDIVYFCIVLGLIFQKNWSLKVANSPIILIYIGLSYFSLWNASLHFSLAMPISIANELMFPWKNYVQMIFLYFLAANIAQKEKDQRIILLIMAFTVMIVSIRAARNFNEGASFSYDRRSSGPFEVVGLGPNHFGAFLSYYCVMFLGLYYFLKEKKQKYFFLAASLAGLPGLLFSYSRGAFAATMVAISFFGIKKRALIILLFLFLIFWKFLLPVTVVERITMTKTNDGHIEASASHRLVLWDNAMLIFCENPLFGVGFNGFGFSLDKGALEDAHNKTDTHNYFLKIACEQGIIGLFFTLYIFAAAFLSGLRLFKTGKNHFHIGLGFGFMGCIIACIIANLFGDRFSYFVLGSYFWICWGLIDRILSDLK